MQKLTMANIASQQIIDTRLQYDYQTGSIQGAINIPYAKFEKVAPRLLDLQKAIVFILENEDDELIQLLEQQAKNQSFNQIDGYLLVADIPKSVLQQFATIPAKAFLDLPNDDYLLLDVREQATVTKPAPTKNLVTISLNDLANEYNQLDMKKEIFTLCGSGNSATTAASFLENKGLKATVIEGGMTAIQKEQEK